MALVFLLKLVDLVVYLVERTHLVQRESHDAALLCYCLKDALADPPHGVGDELEASGLIEFLCCLDESDVAFVYKVGQSKALMLILLGNRYDKSKIGCHQLVLCSFALTSAFLDFLCEFNLLVDGNQRRTTYLNEVFVECFTGTVGNTFLNF